MLSDCSRVLSWLATRYVQPAERQLTPGFVGLDIQIAFDFCMNSTADGCDQYAVTSLIRCARFNFFIDPIFMFYPGTRARNCKIFARGNSDDQ